MRTLLIVAGLMISLPAYAGWFGPSNYEECVLNKMKGQKADIEDTARDACRIKFPCPADDGGSCARKDADEQYLRALLRIIKS